MFSRKKIAVVSVLVGGLAVACAGTSHATVGETSGGCTRDLLGNISCTQRIQGVIPEDGVVPHQETCMPVKPLTLPAAWGTGTTRLGPEVTCSPTTTGAPDEADGVPESFGLTG
ncbi:hypothetical protein [Streptomyces chromofuscus]|uniref:Secreted protein n=1 Tax=Streptomyces chromofuscus TaxID=42881 RepID=A0A7M2T4B8_STRCW|nr:hypothetical protein [Streptomyces chromofuscus]QOV42733.1 hypothetical protein IPT68_23390 [Streptomyces chromofuscus]GGS90381.1 hypothetical protein GCM10010254_07810 [Streptomyces chromofuscus]